MRLKIKYDNEFWKFLENKPGLNSHFNLYHCYSDDLRSGVDVW